MLVNHSFLDLVLSRTIKKIDQLSEDEANELLAKNRSWQLRKRAEESASKILGGKTTVLVQFRMLLENARKASEGRNVYAHGHWKNRDGELSLLDKMHAKDKPLPSTGELRAFADSIRKAALDIDEARARAGGFLHDALHAARN